MEMAKTYRDVKRLRQIVDVLFKYELGYVIERLNLKSLLPIKHRTRKEKFSKDFSKPRNLRLAFEELGATFIKLGQLLSLRPDLIPKEYCREFALLQDDVKSIPFNEVKGIVERELKKPLNEIFVYFNETPIAAASIGQVHKAKLKNNEIVAVKVQRPNVGGLFSADIDLLYHLVALIEHHFPGMDEIRPKEIVKEFEAYTKNELDYTLEASNISIFYNNFRKSHVVKIPKVYWDYTTTKVLTMEFIDGKKLTEANIIALKASKKELVKNVVNCFITQVIEYSIFHADPHPGNIFLIDSKRFALLDFGIVGKINSDMTEKIETMFLALMKPDKDLLIDSLIDLGFVEGSVNIMELKSDMSKQLGKYYGAALKDISTSELIYDMLAMARKYHLKLPVNFILLLKAMITVEGFGKELNPNFVFIKETKPMVDKIIEKRSSLSYVFRNWREKLISTSTDTIKIPKEINMTLKELREGHVKVKIVDPAISNFAYEVDKSSNRITFGLVIAGTLVAAAIIALAKIPPFFRNVPLLTIGLLIISAIFTVFLIISILKEKRGGMKR